MIILFTADTEGNVDYCRAHKYNGLHLQVYIIIREFYKKYIQFLATIEACVNYVPSVRRHCGIVLARVSIEAPQYP